jgi:hypothetical protein
MVRQVPGFQLENNADSRGYNNALGNLLINDRRPTAKQDQPLAILSRIPVEIVERIELIRGQVRDIDMQGQSTLINIVLREDVNAAVQWEAYLRKTFRHGDLTPKIAASLSHRWGEIDYQLGLNFRRSRVGDNGTEEIFDAIDALTERRSINQENKNTFFSGNFSAATWLGESFLQLNGNFMLEEHVFNRRVRHFPVEPPGLAQEVFNLRDAHQPFFELGLDVERELSPDLDGKLIMLFFREYLDSIETRRNVEATGEQSLIRVTDTFNITTEGITRLELDWSGLEDHVFQVNLEGAYNILNGKLDQTEDTGAGPVLDILPGANSRVEELRGDFVVKDTWTISSFKLEYGLGAELSRINQSGDLEQERSFFFIKPQVVVNYSPQQGRLTRLRMAREVSQLNLNDFISANVFDEDDLALGNPDIRPDATWISELSHERRFGSDISLKLTLFHHWIKDVLDLLPLTSEFEAPGNIGNGRRWGLELESTLPLEALRLNGARLRLKGRLQDSRVTDPITGEHRELSQVTNPFRLDFFSLDTRYAYTVDFRQDFDTARMAWGFDIQQRGERPQYKVNELDIRDNQVQFDAFFETTRFWGIKMRVDYENIFDLEEERRRTIYVAERDLTPVASRELRNVGGGPRVFFTVSGSY